MGDIARDSDVVELDGPPDFDYGERVICRYRILNDGTFPGKEVGEVLVERGEIGYVVEIGTFIQQFYIYSVEFSSRGYRVGMKGRELVPLAHGKSSD